MARARRGKNRKPVAVFADSQCGNRHRKPSIHSTETATTFHSTETATTLDISGMAAATYGGAAVIPLPRSRANSESALSQDPARVAGRTSGSPRASGRNKRGHA
jgi:hypothetical protein